MIMDSLLKTLPGSGLLVKLRKARSTLGVRLYKRLISAIEQFVDVICREIMTVVSLKAAHGDVVIPASSKENIFMSTRSQYGLRDMISILS